MPPCSTIAGSVYDKMGDHDRAIADYDEAIRLKPDLANAFNNRGATYEAKGDHDRAIADYAQAVHLKPDYAIAFKNRGLAYNAKGDRDLAIADFNEAIRLKPDYAVAYNDRGLVYEAKGDHDHAMADYNEAIRLRPEYADAFHNRGVAYDHTGDHDRAFGRLQRGDPPVTRLRLRVRRSRIYLCSRRVNMIARSRTTTRPIRLKPDYGTAFNNRGYEYYLKGEYDRAIADYDRGDPSSNPTTPSQFNNRGLAYAAKGDYDLAIADCTEAIRLDPKLANPHRHRAFAYFRKGDLDRALSDLEDAIRLDPKYALAYATRGMVFEKKGDLPRALAGFQSSLDAARAIFPTRSPAAIVCPPPLRRSLHRALHACRPLAGRALPAARRPPHRRTPSPSIAGRADCLLRPSALAPAVARIPSAVASPSSSPTMRILSRRSPIRPSTPK